MTSLMHWRLRLLSTPLLRGRFSSTDSTPTTSRRRRRGSSIKKATNPAAPQVLDPSLISSMASCVDSASLSPYLPVPISVARDMMRLANAQPHDVHYELGSGDGRVNLVAVEFGVAKSVGVEVDGSLLQLARENLEKQESNSTTHPLDYSVVSFVQADLMNPSHSIWKSMDQEATVITMYFVENALRTIRPMLPSNSCSIVCCGYPIPDWTPTRQVQSSRLPLYLYERPVQKQKDESSSVLPS